jgi:elongator complex protein 6
MSQPTPILLQPYLEDSLGADSLSLVTSTLSTPATWLLAQFLKATLDIHGEQDSGPQTTPQQPSIVFVSIYRPQEVWTELSRKAVSCSVYLLTNYLAELQQGVDLPGHLKQNRICYIDGLTQITAREQNLKALDVETVLSAIRNAVQQPLSGARSKPTIIIDGLDLILASRPDVDVIQVQRFLAAARVMSNRLVISASGDTMLIHNRHESATPLEREHAKFVMSTAYQSLWVYQLRALNTGSARDVTGVLRVSRGGADQEVAGPQSRLEDAEWLYQVKGDGSIRMWSRGD